jgi:lysylphosphatidylglycerol synthetase-like protein (DUF2156 family)
MSHNDTFEQRMLKRLKAFSTIGLFILPILAGILYWKAALSPGKCLAITVYAILLFVSNRLSLIEINWNPSRKILRDFGVIALLACPILAAILYYWKHVSIPANMIIISIGIVLYLVSRLSLILTRWMFMGLTLLVSPIGFSVSFVGLAFIFFGLLTPMGLIFRLIGRDPLRLRKDNKSSSNWVVHVQNHDPKRYYRQF